jgi:hypothetical protein
LTPCLSNEITFLNAPEASTSAASPFTVTEEPGSAVSVNGDPADVDAAGNFKKVISFDREGVNVITVRAVDGAGNETLRRETVMIDLY